MFYVRMLPSSKASWPVPPRAPHPPAVPPVALAEAVEDSRRLVFSKRFRSGGVHRDVSRQRPDP
eukprot:9499049-Pyramimonas_sp.AAC.1